MSLFSHRTNWELSDNPLSIALEARKAGGQRVLDLTESNPTRAGIVYPPELFLGAFHNEKNLLYAPEPKGMLKARQAVADYLSARSVIPRPMAGGSQKPLIESEDIVLTASTSEAYSFLFRLLADPGDKILLPAPSYPLFSYLADINDVQAVYYHLIFDGLQWGIDFESIEKAAKAGKVKAVVLVSPNNPTGSFISEGELKILNVLCTRYNMAIISDEVFGDYVFPESRADYHSLADNNEVLSFALGGLSKALALPQMKLAWIAANGPKDILADALARVEVITDTFLSVSTPVQNACIDWLPKAGFIQQQIMCRVTDNLAWLNKTAAAGNGGVYVYPVNGGWYAVVRADLGLPEDEWAVRLLNEHGVYVHPGFYFDFETEGHIVLSLLTPPEIFRQGLSSLSLF